jgi:hypothetical protein
MLPRSGSSLLGDIISVANRTSYFFEPFYVFRQVIKLNYKKKLFFIFKGSFLEVAFRPRKNEKASLFFTFVAWLFYLLCMKEF